VTPRILDVGEQLRGDPVHPRGVALEQRVERVPVALARPPDERDVAEAAVGRKARKRDVAVGEASAQGLRLHGGVHLHGGR